MNKKLKSSLFAGVASLALLATFGAINQGVSAASKSGNKIVSDKLMNTDPASRNVELTGTQAVYSKVPTLKGADQVVTKTTAKLLSQSKNDNDNFRAYRVAKTKSGNVYYKVVSFDQNYRGWVYAGKAEKFANGLKRYTTFSNDASVKLDETSKYVLSGNAVSDTNNYAFFNKPAYTLYKIGRKTDSNGKTIASTDKYKNTTFTLTNAVKNSRSGDIWYQIKSDDKDIDGSYVPATDVIKQDDAVADNAVKVIFTDSTNRELGTATLTKDNAVKGDALGTLTNTAGDYAYTLTADQITAYQKLVDTALNNSGYSFNVKKNQSVLAGNKTGSVITVPLSKQTTVYQKLTPYLKNTSASDDSSVTLNKLTAIPTNAVNPQAFTGKVTIKATKANGLSSDYTFNFNKYIAKDGTFDTKGFQTDLAAYLNGGTAPASTTASGTTATGAAAHATGSAATDASSSSTAAASGTTATGAAAKATGSVDTNASSSSSAADASSSSTTSDTSSKAAAITSAEQAQLVTDFNKDVGAAAASTYVAPTGLTTTQLFSGNQGESFTTNDVKDYLTTNGLNTLKSGVYPTINASGNVTYSQYVDTFAESEDGTFGTTPAKVVYSFNSTAPTTLKDFPTVATSSTPVTPFN